MNIAAINTQADTTTTPGPRDQNGLVRRIACVVLMAGAIAAAALGCAAVVHAGAAPALPHTVTHAPDANPNRNGIAGHSPSPHIHHRHAHQHAG